MVTETLKSLIGRLNTAEELDKLPAMLAATLNTFDAGANFHPQFRSDILAFLTSSVELGALMADDEYDAGEVIRRAFRIMSLLPGFIKQAEDSKLATLQWAIQNRISRARLPSVFTTKAEAETHLRTMGSMLDTSQLEVIEIRVSLVTGSPPRAVTSQPALGNNPAPNIPTIPTPPIPARSHPSDTPLTTQQPEDTP